MENQTHRPIKLWIIFIGMLGISLTACHKEDYIKDKPEQFIGEWQWVKTVAYYFDGNDYDILIGVDTIYPYDADWGVDFTCSFEVKENGDVHLFKNDYLFQNIKSKKMQYLKDANPDVRNYYSVGSKFEDRGVYQRLYIENNVQSLYAGVHGFPIDGGSVGNEYSIINKNGSVVVFNIFKRK